jgi:outer membrane protein
MKFTPFAGAVCLAGGFAGAALAQTTPNTPDPSNIWGKQAGSFVVRVGVGGVLPLDSSSHVDIIGGKIQATNSLSSEVDLSYFFTDQIALQVIAASTRHEVSVANSVLGPKLDLGSTWVLPPTVLLQYHFFPQARLSPYVGAGLNVTFFYAENAATPPIDKLSLSNSIGGALEAGVDYNVSGPWFLNLDFKQLFLTTDARVHALGLLVKASDALNPAVVSTGVAYRF